jgi:hypothetical protein
VEVRFYPEYRRYYSLYNDGGSISDIEAAEDRRVEVLSRELTYCGYRQAVCTVLFVVFGGFIMDVLPLGMMDLGKGIFRTLCVGYGLYAIANAMMLILLYFEDYTGSVLATGAFALVANTITIWQAARGDTAYYGVGFMAGAIVYFTIAIVRLEWSTRRLPYLLLGRQEAFAAPAEVKGGDEGDPRGDGGGGCGDDGGEGHDREGDVGDIVEERAQEAVLDLAADQGQGQHADQIGHRAGNQNVKVGIAGHADTSSSLMGNSRAATAEMDTVRKITRAPSDMMLKKPTVANTQLKNIETTTSAAITLSLRAGGTNTAMNMP